METVIENFLSFSSSVQYTVAIALCFLSCETKKIKAMHITYPILIKQYNTKR